MRHIFNRPFVLSALLAMFGAAAAFVALTDARGAWKPTTAPVSVVVAVRSLNVGQRLELADVALREVPGGLASPDAALSLSQVEGRYASMPLLKGETVLLPKLSASPPGSNLASLIPAGRVAISLAVSDVVSTGGFIAPGDRVDVLGVVSREAGDLAQLVLSDVPVIAVANKTIGANETTDAASRSTSRENPRSLISTVTLAVTVDQAQRLVQVDEIGKLRLALRPRSEVVAKTN